MRKKRLSKIEKAAIKALSKIVPESEIDTSYDKREDVLYVNFIKKRGEGKGAGR